MIPRSAVFDPKVVGIYHCFNQCVRQLFLLGDDPPTVQRNGQRQQMAVDELRRLAGVMGIEVLDFALMDNHVHCVLRNRPDVVASWSSREAASRWWVLCPGRRNRDGSPAECTEEDLDRWTADAEFMEMIRERLSSISWFMWFWLGKIAKTANAEDGKRGHFFAGRFKCKRLEDEGALLACSMYTVLNPLRAGMVTEPEEYRFTSLSARVAGQMRRNQRALGQDVTGEDPDAWLAALFLDERAALVDEAGQPPSNPFPSPRLTEKGYLPMNLERYLLLLRWTQAQAGLPVVSVVPQELETILTQLGLAPALWLDTVSRFEELFHYVVGRYEQMTLAAGRLSQRWLQGVRECELRFGQKPGRGSSQATTPAASPSDSSG